MERNLFLWIFLRDFLVLTHTRKYIYSSVYSARNIKNLIIVLIQNMFIYTCRRYLHYAFYVSREFFYELFIVIHSILTIVRLWCTSFPMCKENPEIKWLSQFSTRVEVHSSPRRNSQQKQQEAQHKSNTY